MWSSLNDEEAKTLFRATVAMGAGSVGDRGEMIDEMSSPIDDANRNPTQVLMEISG